MDWNSFANVAVKGVPLLFVVMGMVEVFKKFVKKDGTRFFKGNAILLISLFWGILIGGGYMISLTKPPIRVDWWLIYVYWFGIAIYAIAMGLVASGLYDVIVGIAKKVLLRTDTPAQG